MKRNGRFRTIIQILITAILIGVMFIFVKPREILAVLRMANGRLFWFSLLITPLVIGIKSLRWWLLAKTVSSISFGQALYSYLAGLALAVVTPLAAGEAGRGLFIPHVDKAGLTGKVILDKLVDLSAVALFSGIGLLLLPEKETVIVGIGIVTLPFLGWLVLWLFLPKWQAWFGQRFRRVSTALNALQQTSMNQLLINIGLAFIGFVLFYWQAFLLLQSMWPPADWAVVPTFPIITLSTILPIAIGGVGVREWTAVLLLSRFNIPAQVAFTAFFGHFLIVQFLPALLGVLFITKQAAKPQKAAL